MRVIHLGCPIISTSPLHFKFHFHHFILHGQINKIRSQLHMFWRISKSETIWIKFLIFSSPKLLPYFYFLFFFSVLVHQYSFFYLSSPSHTLSHIFSLTQSAVRPNHTFGPSTQFPLVIFDLQTLAATFDLPSRHAALRYVVSLRGAASPPAPPLLQKWSHPITSPSPFLSPVTSVIKVSPPLPPSPWPLDFRRPTALSKVRWEHPHYPSHPPRLQSLLLALRTISLSEHHGPPLLSVVVWPSPQLCLQVTPLVRTSTTSSLSLSLSYHDDLSSREATVPP
jgi:hypothetical protein